MNVALSGPDPVGGGVRQVGRQAPVQPGDAAQLASRSSRGVGLKWACCTRGLADVLTTAIMAGLLPILWGHGAGASVMQRIAAPMVGGMLSSTILTLVVIPAVYSLWQEGVLRRGAAQAEAATPGAPATIEASS